MQSIAKNSITSGASSVALVTGAGRGIGQAIAIALAQTGVKVGLIARSPAEITETAELASRTGGDALAMTADVSDAESVGHAAHKIESALGPIDSLINNAGILGQIGPFWEAPLSDWRQTIEIDLIGPAICAHAVLGGMIAQRRGRILNVATSMVPTPYYSA
jgi:NAD(P)-dependent dehydrogenase (short-subunit alcohol dehydrogenase family)